MRALTTILDNHSEGARPKSLSLLVMEPDAMVAHALPQAGIVTIGRGDNADVRLGDPLASRLHARLHVGETGTIEIEDLGSINRTRIRDVVLTPGAHVAISPGEAVTIGSTVLMVQESRSFGRPRRVWPHEYFEARLEEECARSADTRAPFAAVRLSVEGDPPTATVVDIMAPALRLPDLLALYAPGELELLLPNTPPEMAAAFGRDLVTRLASRGFKARVGSACYPRDGRDPEVLIARAGDRLRGAGPPAGPTGVLVLDPAMHRVHQLAERAAVGEINVLIVGETGVGKEVMTETIHRLSPRAKARLLPLNCAALSESLLESELFGHEKGAFTGATETKPGLLESAPGGTVFLDEIGELPMSLQAKLLRVIEAREVTRVGGLKPRPIDVRFVAATNRNLDTEIAAGRFRRDLFYRLNGITLHIPPLRERPSEILPLAHAFCAAASRQLGYASAPPLSFEAEALLLRYAWPGNIRELRNVIERAALLCMGDEITPEHLPTETMTVNDRAALAPAAVARADSSGNESERDRILRVLAECVWNQSRAAKRLGIARSTLVEKLDAHQIPRPRKPVG